MPAIPFKPSEQSSSVGAPNRSYSDVKANEDMFGGGVGRAAAGLGSAIGDAAELGLSAYNKDENQKRAERVAFVSAQTDLVTPSLNARLNAPPDGQGVAQKTWNQQMQDVERIANEQFPGDAKAQSAYKTQKYAEMGHIRNSNVQFQVTQAATYNKQMADDGLNAVYNKIRTDPTIYDEAVRQGHLLIDNSSAVPASDKVTAKLLFSQNAANTRFEGQLTAAKTIDDVKGIEAELTSEDNPWQGKLSADQYKALTTKIESQKKVFQVKAAAEVSTAISTARTYVDDPAAGVLPQETLEGIRRKIEAGGSETSTAHMTDFARLVRDNQIKENTRGLPAYQIAALRDNAKGGPGQAYPNLPPEMSDNINKVSKMFPGVSGGYLGATATIEYGGQFRKDGKTDYGVKSDTSSATGVYQFIDKTWDDVTNNPGVKAVLKANGFDNITRDLRKDPLASTIAAAALASQNKSVLQAALHRDVSDSELYMAHFMGAETAAKFISSYVTSRDALAATMNPDAAAANRTIYYTKEGRPRTVAEVYDLFTTRFAASPSQVTYGDGRTYDKIYEGAIKAQSTNPIGYAASHGTHTVIPLDQPGAWEARGATARDIGTYYRIPDADNKPLDVAKEVPQIKKQLSDGAPEEVAQLLGNIGSMDRTAPGMSAAALDQLGEKHSAIGVAAQLMQGSAPDMATASTIIRGQKQIDAGNKTALGDKSQADDAFNKATGTSLNFLDPKAREAIQRAAEAHYVQTAGAADSKFVEKGFVASINAVMGGSSRIGEVNSVKTILPAGVDERTFNKIVDNFSQADLVSLSVDRRGQPNGMTPVYSNGDPTKASDISAQGKLRYVGGDTYEVYMGDNKRLVTHDIDTLSGGAMPYRMKLDKPTVVRMASNIRVSSVNDIANASAGIEGRAAETIAPPPPDPRKSDVTGYYR